jgi:hypothetical protein
MAGCVKCSKECSRVVGVATRSERDPGPSARIYASPMGRANKCGDPRSCPSNPIWADVVGKLPRFRIPGVYILHPTPTTLPPHTLPILYPSHCSQISRLSLVGRIIVALQYTITDHC